MDCVNLLHETLQTTFGPLDWLPIADGRIHRFHVPGDKPGTLNGAYQLFPDGIASGWFGTWKDGSNWQTWSSRKPADYLEAQLIRQRIEQAQRRREAEQHQNQQAAADYANRLWCDACRADPEHSYLVAKGCRPHGLRQLGEVLLVPLYYAGQLVNLQRIHPDGAKRFLRGGMVKGCCSTLGAIVSGQPLYTCEGWATGATIHEEIGHPVACAMNAGNLLSVALQLRRRYPKAVLIVAGDDDRMTEGNPGRSCATKVADELGCGLIFPPWSGAEPLRLSDFNDLRQWREGRA